MQSMKPFLSLMLLLAFIAPTFQSQFDYKLAFEMLRASSASYCNETELNNMGCGPVCNDLKGYTFLLQFVVKFTLGQSVSYSFFVNTNTKRLVLSFRGSTSVQQIIDEVINGGSTKFALYDIPKAEATKYFYQRYVEKLRESFLSNLKAQIKNHPGYQVYFVGHSLGGAFATLAVLDVVLGGVLKQSQVKLFTYGCPRVGNAYLANAVEEKVAGEMFRMVHHKDLVVHVPPCVTNLKGECQDGKSKKTSQKDNLLYYAWHVSPEIFFNADSSQYKVCTRNEDPTCSAQFRLIEGSISDHLNYFGVSTSCGGNSVFGKLKTPNSFLSKVK